MEWDLERGPLKDKHSQSNKQIYPHQRAINQLQYFNMDKLRVWMIWIIAQKFKLIKLILQMDLNYKKLEIQEEYLNQMNSNNLFQ